MAYVAVVGAANVDIGGFVAGRVVAEDSNPGRVRMSMGGVGRNIACNLSRMGTETELITALGGDGYADMIRADCARSGVGLKHAMSFPEEATSTYLFIAGSDGDMAVAVNDMGIHDRLIPERLESALEGLNGAQLVVLEANPPQETLEYLAQRLNVPVIADAVSAAKTPKLRGVLPHLDAFKPNRIEAELLTGIAVRDERSAKEACRALLDTGLRSVFLTMGVHGVCCGDADELLFLPGMEEQMKNATGAGDAFTAAIAWAKTKSLTLRETALAGMAAASIAIGSHETVSPDMSSGLLAQRMNEINHHMGGR